MRIRNRKAEYILQSWCMLPCSMFGASAVFWQVVLKPNVAVVDLQQCMLCEVQKQDLVFIKHLACLRTKIQV